MHIRVEFRGKDIVNNFQYFFGKSKMKFEDMYFSIFPKHESMKPYWKYIKHVIAEDAERGNEILDMVHFEFPKEEDIPYISEFSERVCYNIVFEFPDEETAFYFKMKFC